MKVVAAGTPTEKSGVGESRGFTIAANREAFVILSSGLYNDKVRAVIRELSCNAWDAHQAAGKANEPIEVHLPTQFDPNFRVKDNGIGLSHDEVMNLYCTYFDSNKNKSNDYIGGFGLGSKSPFAYLCQKKADGTIETGGFFVTSRYQGMTRIYSAQISESGMPEIVLMSEEKTPDAPNGLEVGFPVKQQDVWEFENKAKKVFEFFTPRPKINKSIAIDKQNYTVSTEKWGLRGSGSSYSNSGLRAIIGNVQYNVGQIDESRMTEDQQSVANLPLDLFFSIGEVNITPSRESLQLDEASIANILKALDNVHTTMLEEVKKKLQDCPTLWEARIQIYNLISQGGAIGKIVNDAKNRGLLMGTYKNFTMTDKKAVINELDYVGIQVTEYRSAWRYNAKKAKKEVQFAITPEFKKNAIAEIRAKSAKREDFQYEFDVEPTVNFVINDLPKNAERYINYHIQEQNAAKKVYLIGRVNQQEGDLDAAVKAGLDMLQKLGGAPVTLASELKEKYGKYVDIKKTYSYTPREKRLVSQLTARAPYVQRGNGWTKAWFAAMEETINAPGTKYYVLLERNADASVATGFSKADTFHNFVQSVRNAGLAAFDETTPVFGLRPNSKHLKNPNWKPFMPAVWDALRKHMTPTRLQKMDIADAVAGFRGGDWDFVFKYIADNNKLDADSPMQQFCNMLEEARKTNTGDRNQALSELLYKASQRNEYTRPENKIDLDKQFEDIKNMYPMLKISDRKGYGSGTIQEKTTMTEYFKMVDALRKAEAEAKLVVASVEVANVVNEKETVNV